MSEWMIDLIEEGGYGAIAALMLLENVFPPLPSEVVMPLAGYVAQRGDANVWLVALAGAAGSLAGAFFWYWVGWALGIDRLRRFAARYGRWLALTEDDIDRADRWFERYGGLAISLGRLAPVVRTLISVPAGIYRMPLRRFAWLTALGVLAWTGFLTAAGWWLGAAYGGVNAYIGPASNLVLVALIAWQALRIWRARRSRNPS